MAYDQDLEDLEAFFRRLESDPESIDAATLIRALQTLRRWILVSSTRLQILEDRVAELEAARRRLEERMAQLETALEALQRRHEESAGPLRQILTAHLWWELAREGRSLFSTN